MPKIYRKVNGSWVPIKRIYRKVSGSWSPFRTVYRKINGFWYLVFAGKTSISQTVTISQSTNSTTDLVTLTGTNYNWDPAPSSLTYEFRKSGVGVIGTGSIANPNIGLTETKTFLISASSNLITPNQANNFTFAVSAVYAGPDEESVSTATTVYGPGDITVSAGTITQNSIQVNWTASSNANRYKVEYKLSTATSYTFYGGTSLTSVTISGLEMNKTYNFRITPYTGDTNSGTTFTGYEGNQAWLTESTKELYTVTWDVSNGGSVTPTSATQTEVGGTVSVPTPTYSGYQFNGWYASATSPVQVIAPGTTTYTPTSNITLYAQWTRKYTVTYYINGGTGSVPVDSNTYSANATVTVLFSPTPTIANGTFKGWDEDPNASAAGGAHPQYSNLSYPYSGVTTFSITKDMSLYAIYLMDAPPTNITDPSTSTSTAYIGQTVTSDGGTWTSNTKSYQYQWQYQTPFGWTNSTGTGSTTLSYTVNGLDIYTSGSNIRLQVTAWTGTTPGTGVSAIDYSLPIAVYATGTCSIAQVSGTNNYSITNSYSSNIYRTDYLVTSTSSGVGNNFANGSTSPTYSWTNYATPTQSGSASTVTVTDANKYIYALQLVYDSNTGRYYKSNQASFGPTQLLPTAPAPTFDANTSTATGFVGQINNYQGSNYTYSFATSAGTVNPGTPNSFNSTYPFTVTGLTAGQSATVTVTISRSGYISSTGTTTGTALTGPTFSVPTFVVPSFTVTLYTVTWNANGGIVSPTSSTQTSAGGTVSVPVPNRTGFDFNGWYNAASGGTRIITPGTATYIPTSNITLYAQWTTSTTYRFCNKTDASNTGCIESSCILGGSGGTCTPTPSFATPSFPSFATPNFPSFSTPSFSATPSFTTPSFTATPTFSTPSFTTPSFTAQRRTCNRTDAANIGCAESSCGVGYSGNLC